MPKHEQPFYSNPLNRPCDKTAKTRWQDLNHGPAKGQRQAKHSKALRVPGKGSGR